MAKSRLIRWLTVAAMLDWLLGRTLSRSAIFMPKPPAVVAGYQAVTQVGQFAANLASLLAIAALIWIAWDGIRRRERALAAAVIALLSFSLAALVFTPTASIMIAYNLAALATVLFFVLHALRRGPSKQRSTAVILTASTIVIIGSSQAMGTLLTTLGLDRPFEFGLAAFAMGEMLVIASGFAFIWWMRPKKAERWMMGVALAPTLVFAAIYLGAPSISGVLAIWSVGLTLSFPWPLYALSIWAYVTAALIGLRRQHPAGLAIPLLLAGGYASQLSTHLFFSLIALFLLADAEEVNVENTSERSGQEPSLKLWKRLAWRARP